LHRRRGGRSALLADQAGGPSVLDRFSGPSGYENHAGADRSRAAAHAGRGRHLLGWQRADPAGDFYVRQLRDWKGSADLEQMNPSAMSAYGRMCGWTLARAHARSGDRVAIAGYLGSGEAFDTAIVTFAEAYADQNERDYQALADAVKTGRVAASPGL
jgi:hypothetical protein